MTKYSKLIKKKLLIFDFDGVIADSIKNMEISWNHVRGEFNLESNFNDYKKYLGLPFEEIIKNIEPNKLSKVDIIKSSYFNKSSASILSIKLFQDVKKTIKLLKNRGKIVCIVTSKNFKRVHQILMNHKIIDFFDYILTSDSTIKGKPNPDQVNYLMNKFKVSKKNTIFIGDGEIDYLTAINSDIDFIYAAYGYGLNHYENKIDKFIDILKKV